MSTKGTLFLTSDNDHVYDETLDWSIVFEISRPNIEEIVMTKFDKNGLDVVNITDYAYVVIQTNTDYDFHKSYKSSIRSIGEWIRWETNTPDCLYFACTELQSFETDNKEYPLFSDVRIYLKKETEWYNSYIERLKKTLNNEIDLCNRKLEVINEQEKKRI